MFIETRSSINQVIVPSVVCLFHFSVTFYVLVPSKCKADIHALVCQCVFVRICILCMRVSVFARTFKRTSLHLSVSINSRITNAILIEPVICNAFVSVSVSARVNECNCIKEVFVLINDHGRPTGASDIELPRISLIHHVAIASNTANLR